jgi:hypothetical protein
MLHKETVSTELINTALVLCAIPELSSFRIVGGTATALQIGHRRSIDIDFFSTEKVSKKKIVQVLSENFKLPDLYISSDNVSGEINGVRVDLYDSWLIPFKEEPVVEDGIRLTSLQDIAAFKLNAITERREKKDYIDLFFLFKEIGSSVILKKFKEYNPLISHKSILFALSEVKTAEENNSPMPDMLVDIEWSHINKSMLEAAKDYFAIVNKATY